MKVIIVDIDGTIADTDDRLNKSFEMSNGKRNQTFWNTFMSGELVLKDPPIKNSAKELHSLSKDHAIVYLSGRRDTAQVETEKWIKMHNYPAGKVFLRTKGERTERFKKRIIEKIQKKHDVVCGIGDRDSDIEVYEITGIPIVEFVESNKPWKRKMCRVIK